MNEQLKSFSIKVILTIPAIGIGIFSAILMILKPLIDLWVPPKQSQEPLFDVHPTPEVEEIKHDFH